MYSTLYTVRARKIYSYFGLTLSRYREEIEPEDIARASSTIVRGRVLSAFCGLYSTRGGSKVSKERVVLMGVLAVKHPRRDERVKSRPYSLQSFGAQ